MKDTSEANAAELWFSSVSKFQMRTAAQIYHSFIDILSVCRTTEEHPRLPTLYRKTKQKNKALGDFGVDGWPERDIREACGSPPR